MKKRTEYEYKECKWCGKPLARKPFETSSNYRNRHYCNQSCNTQHQNAKRYGK